MRSLKCDADGGKIMLQKDADADEKVESFENVQAALRKGSGGYRYMCSLCMNYHPLDLVANTSALDL